VAGLREAAPLNPAVPFGPWQNSLVSSHSFSAMSAVKKANVVVKEVMVVNKLGIHARPAAMFVKAANAFASKIFVEKDGETVNGKSIMGLMMLAAGPGSKIRMQADGPDAAQAITTLEALVNRKFDEE
jgi:phosphocarrier protein